MAEELSQATEFVTTAARVPQFTGTTRPSGLATSDTQTNGLVVNSYYIDEDSETREGLPSLRRKSLGAAGGAAVVRDEEIIQGVEDLQVQFGIDTGDYDNYGVIDPGLDADSNGIPDAPRGIATRYVDPDALPVGFQVVSVRIWLMMRSAQFEAGFVDGRTYDYAGKSVTPNDGNRRMLVSRTIQLRNARQL